MKEEEFQNKVLIPLFRAMKFNNVKPFGGGILERGKDIIMWKYGELKERINYGVVVKAVKVTGKAIGNGSAAEVLSQIRQTLTSEYFDPVTSQKQKIDFCWIISSKEILKEAIFSIEGQLKESNLDKMVRFIDKNDLLQLIAEHLPTQSLFEKLTSSQKELDELMKNAPYRIVATTENHYLFKSKPEHPNISIPIKISLNPENTEKKPDLDKATSEIIEFLKTGKPTEIEGDFIEFEMAYLPDSMQPPKDGSKKLIFHSIRGIHKLPVSIEVESINEEVITLDYIDLESTQQGTEEITLTNESQNVPWQVKCIINHKSGQLHISFNFDFQKENITLKQELIGLKFLQNLESGQKIKMKHLELGLVIYEGAFLTDSSINVSESWIKLLEKLIFIEQKAKVRFFKNKSEIPVDEIKYISNVAELIKSAKQEYPSGKAESTFSVEHVKAIIKKFANGKSAPIIHISNEIKVNIWGVVFNFGRALTIFEGIIGEKEIERIKTDLKDKSKTEIDIEFLSKSGTVCEIYYPKWLSSEQNSNLQKFISSDVIQGNKEGLFIKC